jgi:hypothetical protein
MKFKLSILNHQAFANRMASIALIILFGSLILFGVLLKQAPQIWLADILAGIALITSFLSFWFLPKKSKDGMLVILTIFPMGAAILYFIERI